MKTLLAILMSFIVTEAPVLAIHGGYTLGSAQAAQGTYAGVLVPTTFVNLAVTGSGGIITEGVAGVDFGTNSLGLFTLNIPSQGVGNGSVVIFSGASQATGSIDALPDPNSTGGIIGVLQATAEVQAFGGSDIFGDVTIVNEITGEASGSITAVNVTAPVGDSNSPTGINLSGTSEVTFSVPDVFGVLVPAQQVTYNVEGFQQSASATETSGTF